MNNAKKRYKTKIIRKYIEIYPNEYDLIGLVEELKKNDIPFNRYVKALIRTIREIAKDGAE